MVGGLMVRYRADRAIRMVVQAVMVVNGGETLGTEEQQQNQRCETAGDNSPYRSISSRVIFWKRQHIRSEDDSLVFVVNCFV